jgi:hypothetical protein
VSVRVSKKLEDLEKRISSLEDDVKSVKAYLGITRVGPKVIKEEAGVKLVEGYDMFGSYAVISASGEVYSYKDLKRAQELFDRLVGQAPTG